MTARDSLAKAHATMTPAQIATHALDLVTLVAKQHGVIAAMAEAMAVYHDGFLEIDRACRELYADVVRARDFLDSGQIAPAREIIATIAAAPPPARTMAEILPVPPFAAWLTNPVVPS